MNTIHDKWSEFEKVINPSAGAIQRKEMRRSFYAGAMAVLSITINIGDDAISEDAGVAMIEGLHQETQLFAAQVIKGDA
jgi:hypothetical protein